MFCKLIEVRVTYHPHLLAILEYTRLTFVKVRAMLTARYAATKRAWPLDVKPGTFRTRRFLTFLVELEPEKVVSGKMDSIP